MGVPVSRRNLYESRTRFIISTGGIALAMLLILVLDGVFAGAMRQVTTYIDETDFDIVIAQEGVLNLHMTTSFIPKAVLDEVAGVPGVKEVSSILYSTVFLVSGDESSVAYLIGYEPGRLGGPWETKDVPAELGHGEIVIDEAIAEKHGLEVGDTIMAGSFEYTIGGLTQGTVNIVNSIAFIRYDDFQEAYVLPTTASYGFVTVENGRDPSDVADAIAGQIEDVSVQTREGFSESERSIIADMSIDIMRLMNAIAFMIGLVVMGLTVYTSTLIKLREYGVLKAIGAERRHLLSIVVGQAYLSAGWALVVSVAIAFLLALVLRVTGSTTEVVILPVSVARVALATAVVATLASIIPIVRIARLRPAEVFRG